QPPPSPPLPSPFPFLMPFLTLPSCGNLPQHLTPPLPPPPLPLSSSFLSLLPLHLSFSGSLSPPPPPPPPPLSLSVSLLESSVATVACLSPRPELASIWQQQPTVSVEGLRAQSKASFCLGRYCCSAIESSKENRLQAGWHAGVVLGKYEPQRLLMPWSSADATWKESHPKVVEKTQ
ncbi:unnamed protein product, partial [Pleuronectes platessa]